MEFDGDFRHCMMCQSCWAYDNDLINPIRCKIDRFDKNRPEGISPDRLRWQFYVHEMGILRNWRCEFRYTIKEVEKLKAGKYREVHVSLGQAKKILEKVREVM